MDEHSFWNLVRLLRPFMQPKNKRKNGKGKSVPQKNGAKNGLIPTPTKISVALRYFAGGSAYDICIMHGISHTEVFRCVWCVVDAVNKCPELSFNYPECHEKQKKIAEGFFRKSKAGFRGCAGAIDGILIWTEKPTDDSCELSSCGTKKFFCGRKKKFGMNMQGTVDHLGRFLHMNVSHPASTSDYLAFSTMDLFHKLERPNFMAPGLCLFGDNAYVNTPYMATPYKNVRGGSKDDYNFYHSQLRITVECAFGMYVQRWGVLRRPLSAKMGSKKVNCLCMNLCRLHNYCINRRVKTSGVIVTPTSACLEGEDLGCLLDDEIAIEMNSGVRITKTGRPEDLLHGGEHFEDVPADSSLRRWRKQEELPRDIMCKDVERLGLKRPTPNKWYDRTPGKNS